MMELDVDTLSLQELKKLRKEVDRAINTYKDRQKKEAIAEMEEIARERGFNFVDLAADVKRTRKPVPPKFANPQNPQMTWSGRGRRPKWVIAELENGKSMDDLRIRK